MAEMSRKERIKLEKQQLAQEALMARVDAARGVNRNGDSPFSITVETQEVGDNIRDISLHKVSVSVNGKTLFKDTDVKFSAGSRYGLMGPNGRGKSTILRLIATRELPVPKNLEILLVEQEQECEDTELSAVDAVLKSHKSMQMYQEELATLHEKDELSEEELDRLNFLEDELLQIGAASAESKARKILFGLGFPTDWHDRPVKSFSGGWRKRVALASAVFIEPDVLMLDEPTNHLDLNAVLWLDQYLVEKYSTEQKKKKCLIVVSHDAGFLDTVCSHMVHIESFKLHYFQGGYGAFNSQLAMMRAEFDKKYDAFQKVIADKKKKGMSNEKLEEWIKEEVQQGKISDEVLLRRREYKVNFPFREPTKLHATNICNLQNVSFAYPGCEPLYIDVNCALWPESRITLCGPNGIGKSTLLNLMTGALEPTEGHVTLNRQARIGRYNQHFIDKLPLEKTAVECVQMLKQPGLETEAPIRQLLGSFGLEGIVHHQQIATLSGGQKARVAFAVVAAENPHFLLLDEPTNHLDVEAIEALCAAINNFKGGVLVVTHDARLITETGMQLWVAGDKNVKPFVGGLSEYKDYVRQLVEIEDAKREGVNAAVKNEKAESRMTEEEKTAAKAEKKEKVLSALDKMAALKKKKDAKNAAALADAKKSKKKKEEAEE